MLCRFEVGGRAISPTMTLSQTASVYDKIRPYLNAEDLIARLGIEVVRTSGSEAYCRPLCHESAGGESLQINLHTGRWNCRACQTAGVYGDLIDLVEYVRTGGGAPSRGVGKGQTVGHRDAIVWLCDQFGVPYDAAKSAGDPGLAVVHMFAMAAHDHLLERPDVLDWIEEKWGFDREDVASYGIGFMPSPLLPSIAAEADRPQSRGAFRASGLGWYQDQKRFRTRFEGRVTFPYLEHGKALYMIGRSTPWTPAHEDGGFVPKYHKLSVHSDKRPGVSERITNDHLYLETVMDSTDVVVIAEGIADAVALSSLGVPVVSPVTVSFNKVDLERFVRKARDRGITRVEILFDNELSGSGNMAARRVGKQLVERGLAVKVLTLPLGPSQQQARDEVLNLLGPEAFAELERAEPRDRKKLIAEAVADTTTADWIARNIADSKIDAAEWSVQAGAAAPARIEVIRRAGVDVIDMEIADAAKGVTDEMDPTERAGIFAEVILLAAHIEDRLSREAYAGSIAKAAGKGVTKAEILRRIAAERRDKVTPKRKDEAEAGKPTKADLAKALVLPPPQMPMAQQPAPLAPPPPQPGQAAAPAPAPVEQEPSDHAHFAQTRLAVMNAVENKLPEEQIGDFVAQTIKRSMGFTAFQTVEDLFLVRGNQRIAVGLDRHTPAFTKLIWLASGLTSKKASHRAYIAAAVYFLGLDARIVQDVAWSFVERDGSVYFPTGDRLGRLLRISPGKVERTRMSEAKVPAVSGEDFQPFEYIERDGGIARALDCFRWTSIGSEDRLVLVYWLACLPILRRIGTIPILRIEGGSSSGKTRTVDAVSILANGRKSSSVPTAAALISRLSTQMLTLDDNRETRDVDQTMEGTLLQATHLGAREKRKQNTDTGTVIERVSGALLMNGIEPIHDGRSELASRMLILHADEKHRVADSPSAESALMRALLACRDAFWSESARRCAAALELDATHGEALGTQIEQLFGSTKIGRLSAYLRIMYLAWVAGLPEQQRPQALVLVDDLWCKAYLGIGDAALESLLSEELSVSALRYVFAYGASVAEQEPYSGEHIAFDGKYVRDGTTGVAYLGPMRATRLARLARAAGKEMNAPRGIATELRAGQLEQRILDGLDFLAADGFEVDIETTNKGKRLFTFRLDPHGANGSPG